MSSFPLSKTPLFAAYIAIFFAIPCSCDVRSVVRAINNGLSPLQGPNEYFCLFNEEECLYGRSKLCSDREPVCPGDCLHESQVERIRNISPYEFCTDRDLNRFPANIVRARCLCTGCHDGSQEVHQFFSRPIQMDMKVVQLNGAPSVQQCRNGHHCRVQTMRLTVGCHCTFKSSIERQCQL